MDKAQACTNVGASGAARRPIYFDWKTHLGRVENPPPPEIWERPRILDQVPKSGDWSDELPTMIHGCRVMMEGQVFDFIVRTNHVRIDIGVRALRDLGLSLLAERLIPWNERTHPDNANGVFLFEHGGGKDPFCGASHEGLGWISFFVSPDAPKPGHLVVSEIQDDIYFRRVVHVLNQEYRARKKLAPGLRQQIEQQMQVLWVLQRWPHLPVALLEQIGLEWGFNAIKGHSSSISCATEQHARLYDGVFGRRYDWAGNPLYTRESIATGRWLWVHNFRPSAMPA
ncbi:MAG: hypothetical protein WC901_03645 [Candidatus Margulisiibacteriota bacterium]